MILITWLKVHNTEQAFLMFKYVINIIWHGSFRITSHINPRPVSYLELKLSGWYEMWYGKSHIIFSIYFMMIWCNLYGWYRQLWVSVLKPGLIWGPILIFNVKPVSEPFYYIVINILVTSSEILWNFLKFLTF